MKKLFLIALVCAANICMQTHSFQSNTQQLPREVIQELKLKQQAEAPSQPAPESMPSKTNIALKITGGAALAVAGTATTIATTLIACIRWSRNQSANPIAFAAIVSGLTTMYQAKQLLSDAYNDVTARKEAIAQLNA